MDIFIIIMINIFNDFLLVSMDTAVSLVYNMFSGYNFIAAKPKISIYTVQVWLIETEYHRHSSMQSHNTTVFH